MSAQKIVHDIEQQSDGSPGLNEACSFLPPLPSVIRYYDDFQESFVSIRNPANLMEYPMRIWGSTLTINFSIQPRLIALFVKHVFFFLIQQNLSASTVSLYIRSGLQMDAGDIEATILSTPEDVGQLWSRLRAKDIPGKAYDFLKSVLKFLCAFRFGKWGPEYVEFVTWTLPLPSVEKYAAVRAGGATISLDQEAALIRHLDDLALRIENKEKIEIAVLQDAAMLLCAYQFAMRSIQIAMLTPKRIRISKIISMQIDIS